MKSSFQKIGFILLPVLVYFCLQDIFQVILIAGMNVALTNRENIMAWMMENREVINVLFNSLANVLAAVCLIPFIRKTPLPIQSNKSPYFQCVLWAILAAIVAYGLNYLFTISGIVQLSDTYQNIEAKQYSIPLSMGILLYGIISPLCEELVFRRLLMIRMKNYFSPRTAIVVSSLFFGLYHQNLVQILYGFCMGCLIGYSYEKTNRFATPVLCHGAANLFVYLL